MTNAAVIAALPVLVLSLVAWRLSSYYRCASIADIFWPLHHLASVLTLATLLAAEGTVYTPVAVGLLAVWAIRLATHLSVRQVGASEDRRYQAIRASIGADFDRKSLLLIFLPQALMAWFVSLIFLPIFVAGSWHWAATIGLALCFIGLTWEIIADLQLTAFLKNTHDGQVLKTGLWALCRHPNYFGEWLFWFGMVVTAATANPFFAPLGAAVIGLITFLLLRFTGVARTEGFIGNTRPEYASYQLTVPALFPRLSEIIRIVRPGSQRASNSRRGSIAGYTLLTICLCAADIEPIRAESKAASVWHFDVTIDDKDVGFHRFEVIHDDKGGFALSAQAEFRYKVFGVTVFAYDHEVEERYDANMCLLRVDSKTKTNGATELMSGYSLEGRFLIEEGSVAVESDSTAIDADCLMTFAYWSELLLIQDQILNGQTGELVDVEIAPVQQSAEPSMRFYTLLGKDIDVTLGYEASGAWNSLESNLKNGRKLLYTLRS